MPSQYQSGEFMMDGNQHPSWAFLDHHQPWHGMPENLETNKADFNAESAQIQDRKNILSKNNEANLSMKPMHTKRQKEIAHVQI